MNFDTITVEPEAGGKEALDEYLAALNDPSRIPGTLGTTDFAARFALEGEVPEFLKQLVDSLYLEFRPQSAVEAHFVENMAVTRWRQMRIWGLERATIRHKTEEMAVEGSDSLRAALACQSMAENSRWTEHLSRSEARLENNYRQSLAGFRQHRAWRTTQA